MKYNKKRIKSLNEKKGRKFEIDIHKKIETDSDEEVFENTGVQN